MKTRFDSFIKFINTSLLGGFAVVLPVVITVFFLKWLFNLIVSVIAPITSIILARSDLQEIFASLMVIALIIASCFLIGLMIRTRFGKFIHYLFENKLLKIIPGYKLVKETVNQFINTDGKNSPFTAVAIARLFESSTMVTCFITASHSEKLCTVFVPTGPNPTSGMIYHLPKDDVYLLEDISVEEAMKSIIGCGLGSEKLLKSYQVQKM